MGEHVARRKMAARRRREWLHGGGNATAVLSHVRPDLHREGLTERGKIRQGEQKIEPEPEELCCNAEWWQETAGQQTGQVRGQNGQCLPMHRPAPASVPTTLFSCIHPPASRANHTILHSRRGGRGCGVEVAGARCGRSPDMCHQPMPPSAACPVVCCIFHRSIHNKHSQQAHQ